MSQTIQIYVQSKIFDTVKPVINAARLVGFCPISYTKSDNKYLIEKSNYWQIWGLVLNLILASAATAGMWDDVVADDEESIRMDGPLSTVVGIVDMTSIILMVLVGVCFAPYKMKNFFFLFEKVSQVDNGIPPKITSKDYRKSFITIVTIPVLFIGLCVFDVFQWVKAHYKGPNSFQSFCLHYSAYYILYTIGIVQEIYIWFLVDTLRKRFKNLNEWLEKRKQLSKTFSTTLALTTKPNYAKTIQLSLQEALGLTKIHESICEVIDSLGELHGHVIFLIVFNCFLHLIIEPYFLLIELGRGKIDFVLLQLLWMFATIMRLICVVEPCHGCLYENNKILDTVFRFLNFNLQEDVKKQIVYRTSDFSSCGFFTLDRSLLTAVAGSVTTYLVILVQFTE